jgi:hypothetical protein
MMIFECDACGVQWWPHVSIEDLSTEFEEVNWAALAYRHSPGLRPSHLCRRCASLFLKELRPLIEERADALEVSMVAEWLQQKKKKKF